MKNLYQITEYSSFFVGEKNSSVLSGSTFVPMDKRTFNALENFILSNDGEMTDIMGLSVKKGLGKIITAKNYVGVISMNDGTVIEILPKIYSRLQDPAKTKKLLIDMLRTLGNSPFKSLQRANMDIANVNILEIFIRVFIDEVFFIVKRGLKCNYITVSSNENSFKGKMIFARQIRLNFAHKEKCYVEYDEFNTNRAENKLLKSTLLYLYRYTASSKNKSDIKTLLNSFSDVEASVDYDGDFARVTSDRNMKDYSAALLWSNIFLKGKSFTSFSGSQIAFALLFPMETLFESYIAAQMKKILDLSAYSFSAQDKTYHLFDMPDKKFRIKPDIVITSKSENTVFVFDTKWKILSESGAKNYGISQTDMYQMYAYHKKYNARSVTLIYPQTEKLTNAEKLKFSSSDGVTVKVRFVDLFDIKNSMTAIVNEIYEGNGLNEPQ